MLTKQELRCRIARDAEAEVRVGRWLHGDEGARTGSMGRPAAVLVGVVERPVGPALLLTQRPHHLRDHAGQICFPGGRVEPEDASIAAAALREAKEEIGLDPRQVELIGELQPYDTVTGFRIHPVVGWIEPPIDLETDPYEVEEVFEVPLRFVLDPGNHRRQSYRRGPLTRAYYVLPYRDRFIWGATAGILVNLSTLLR